VNEKTGIYTANILSPTGIASDPALTSYGVEQAKQLATHLVKIKPPIQRFYSSPYYRCIQTLNPTLELLASQSKGSSQDLEILGDNGIGEWYGFASFDHPSPATPEVLKGFFPRYSTTYTPTIIPNVNGEGIAELHNRAAYALHRIIEDCDRDGVEAIVICTHAATIIAIGRALTGRMPEAIDEEDFHPFTCGVTTFVRRGRTSETRVDKWEGPGKKVPHVEWKNGNGVGGGWDCTLSGDCSFLSGGEERGW
jgi:transcription factor C subunit 7